MSRQTDTTIPFVEVYACSTKKGGRGACVSLNGRSSLVWPALSCYNMRLPGRSSRDTVWAHTRNAFLCMQTPEWNDRLDSVGLQQQHSQVDRAFTSWYASSLLTSFAFVCLLDLQTYQAHHSLMPTILATPSVQDVVMRHMSVKVINFLLASKHQRQSTSMMAKYMPTTQARLIPQT